jgi:hypothetical protein
MMLLEYVDHESDLLIDDKNKENKYTGNINTPLQNP